MPTIHLETRIKANMQICFDLSRSIDLHKIATAKTKETAIAGVTSGLIGLGETVTWQAFHLGIKQRLTSIITAFDSPNHFRDEQLKGIFHSFQHDHIFEIEDERTLMIDIFKYRSPLGILGKIADAIFLKNTLRAFYWSETTSLNLTQKRVAGKPLYKYRKNGITLFTAPTYIYQK